MRKNQQQMLVRVWGSAPSSQASCSTPASLTDKAQGLLNARSQSVPPSSCCINANTVKQLTGSLCSWKIFSRLQRLFTIRLTSSHLLVSSLFFSHIPSPSPGELPDPGVEPPSPALQANSLQTEPPGTLPCAFHTPLNP